MTEHEHASGAPPKAPATFTMRLRRRARAIGQFMRARWTRLSAIVAVTAGVLATIGHSLGGVAGLWEFYRVAFHGHSPASGPVGNSLENGSTLLPAVAGRPLSILVLPLANQTGDPTQAYVAEGLTTAITGDLSRISDVVVVPPSTAAGLLEKNLSIDQLGKQARVRFVLEGGVVTSGERVRINAQLYDTHGGAQLWSNTFEGSLGDLFALQDDITARVSSSAGPRMIIAAARDGEKRQQTPQVADLLLRARALGLRPQSVTNFKSMEALYRQALAIEPDNVNAMAGLAGTLAIQIDNFGDQLSLDVQAIRDQRKEALELAQKALVRDPNIPSLYGVLAADAFRRGDIESTRRLTYRALEIAPKSPSALNRIGLFHLKIGEPERAREYFSRALQIPTYLLPDDVYENMGEAAWQLGRYEEAITWFSMALEADPQRHRRRVSLAISYALKGDEKNAREVAAAFMQLEPTFRWNPSHSLITHDDLPWPGKEEAYRAFIETKLRPAVRLAGIPEGE